MRNREAVYARGFVNRGDRVGAILATRDLCGGLGREPSLELHGSQTGLADDGEFVVERIFFPAGAAFADDERSDLQARGRDLRALADCGDFLEEFAALFRIEHDRLVDFGRGRFRAAAVREAVEVPRFGNHDGVLADADRIAGLERDHLHALAVDEGAVHAAEILEHQAPLFVEDAGVVVRDGGIVDHQAVFRRAADADFARADGHFLEHRIFELQYELWHVRPPKIKIPIPSKAAAVRPIS